MCSLRGLVITYQQLHLVLYQVIYKLSGNIQTELHPGHNGVYLGDQKQAILQK